MNYEHIDINVKSVPKTSFNFTMNLDPNAKNYSNCDINGSFYEAKAVEEPKVVINSTVKKIAVDLSGAVVPK